MFRRITERLSHLPRAVIFDVDGTLYDHSRIKFRMGMDLFIEMLHHPVAGYQTLSVLRHYRKVREELAVHPLKNISGTSLVLTAQKQGCSPERVRAAVQQWMFDQPRKYLLRYRHPGIKPLIRFLTENGILTAVFSDYPAGGKLDALGLAFPLVVSGDDPDVDRLKPDPAGLRFCADRLGVRPGDCLYIGDREDKDGECAKRAGMPYWLIQPKNSNCPVNHFHSYSELTRVFQHAISH